MQYRCFIFEASVKILCLIGSAPDYFFVIRLSFFALPASFEMLMLAFYDGNPELCSLF